VVVGKADEFDAPLVPAHGELDPDAIARLLVRRLGAVQMPPSVQARLARLAEIEARPAPLTLVRTPFFCSGCPHNTSTVVPEGSIAGGGIGCHTMALRMDRAIVSVTPMGGEGAQWIGMAPFTETKHIFQNIGDGTLFHSGMLAVKAAVAAGVNITYKVLYNSAVAMTGGQEAAGALPVPALARQLEAEGAAAVAIVSDDPERFGSAHLGFATLHHRDELDEVQRRLREIPGATFLIYDQECAAEKRRLRKRGKRADPPRRVFIDEAVCEGCGDCGVKSNCLSVQPVETEFGRKTRIHQSSCNKDYSCLKGDCPSFLTAVPTGEPEQKRRRTAPLLDPALLPEPARRPACGDGYAIYLMGIGGTGVVTVNSVLGTAALIEGKHVRSLDQTGLSQKGGPVVSHLKLFDEVPDRASRLVAGEADLYLGLDLLVSTSPVNLARAHPDRTTAVVSTSKVPTGEMVTHVAAAFPGLENLRGAIDRYTRRPANLYLDSISLSEGLFGDHMPAGLFLVGAAYQAGLVPLQADSIERAIELNAVSVEANRQAFRWGRRWVIDRAAVEDAAAAAGELPALSPAAREPGEIPARDRAAWAQLVARAGPGEELRRILEIRAPDLAAYQSAAYARTYLDFVAQVAREETLRAPGKGGLAEAVAKNLYKLMAYKDEYEVARLLLRGSAAAAIRRQFPAGAKITYHLHPPLLRALGMKEKLRLGSWIRPGLFLLRSLRRVRGTPFDLFGRAHIRKLERALIAEYRALVLGALQALGPANHDIAVQIAELPDLVRGYEAIKLRGVAAFRARAAELQARLEEKPRGGKVERTIAV
jgi:indolepyruvate ferredoxin oxidoreductase